MNKQHHKSLVSWREDDGFIKVTFERNLINGGGILLVHACEYDRCVRDNVIEGRF